MNKLLKKEFKLSSHILSYLFIAFSLMVFIPNYPLLVGTFFTCLGIFQSFQSYRESNDISYSLLLPVRKKDIVKAKIAFVAIIQMSAFVLMAVFTIIRMLFLKDMDVYANNQLLNANFVYLGCALIVFGLFNFLFVRGYFKTAYYIGKPFVIFCIATFLLIILIEISWHIPGLGFLNSNSFENFGVQLIAFLLGLATYILLTILAYKKSVKSFDKIDL